jgi:hypothetical protein
VEKALYRVSQGEQKNKFRQKPLRMAEFAFPKRVLRLPLARPSGMRMAAAAHGDW